MATISRARATSNARSGGKIVRRKQIATRKTPYDRPTPPSPQPLETPNFLNRVVFPATRMITGAGKLISSVISSAAWSSSSSSSSSAEPDSDFGSEDGVDDEYDDYNIPSDGVGGLNKNGTSSEMLKCFRKEAQLTVGKKSEAKQIIEKLLIGESFSREEGDRLIGIINSRVVDCSTIKEGQDVGLREIPNRRVGYDTPDLGGKALMEAKKWLEEKKVGSSSNLDMDYGTLALNSGVLQHVTEGKVGSPVDIAKSYMRDRPPWSSPSIKHIESRTPSPMATDIFKEGTPYSVGSNSFSAAKKMDSLVAGPWNIQEEIRRVRSKATEDMLRTLPSTKIDLSSFTLETKTIQNSLMADKRIGGRGDKMHESISLAAIKPIDASGNFSAGLSTFHGFPAPSAMEITQDGSQNEVLSSNPATFVSGQNQDLEPIQIVEARAAASMSHHSSGPELVTKQHTAIDPRLSDKNCSSVNEVTECSGTSNANGLPSSKPSLSAGLDTEQNPRQYQYDDENPNPVSSSHDKLTNIIPGEEVCELLSEASIEVPVVNETNTIVSGSENSSSMRYDELSVERTRVNSKRSLTSKATSVLEKEQGKKPSRYQRKGRGRGK